jgi:hypothetical protein
MDLRMERSYVLFGITEFNRRMKHDYHLRVQYGDHTDATSVMHDWGYVGVQQSRQTLLEKAGHLNEVNNFVIKGRARMPNLWLSQNTKRNIRELDTLYIVLRRRKYDGAEALSASTWAQTTTRKRKGPDSAADAAFKRRRSDESQSEMLQPIPPMTLALSSVDAKTAASVSVKAEDKATSGDYYWNWETWTSIDRSAPHPMHYSGDPQGDPFNQ